MSASVVQTLVWQDRRDRYVVERTDRLRVYGRYSNFTAAVRRAGQVERSSRHQPKGR